MPNYAYLRSLVLDRRHFTSAMVKLEVLGYHNLQSIDENYFISVFTLLNIVPIAMSFS